MSLTIPNPRGVALVMAMIVVVLITLLVAGAISFTGTERAASEIQAEEDYMSSCVQAARNLFISRMNMLDAAGPSKIQFNEDLRGVKLATGHFSRLNELSATRVSDSMSDPNKKVQDISNTNTISPRTEFYTVTAVCKETDDPASPEREIEFLVRVGL